MATIWQPVGLSQVYTNHSLQSTAVGHILSSFNVASSSAHHDQSPAVKHPSSKAAMQDLPICVSNFTINGNVQFNFK